MDHKELLRYPEFTKQKGSWIVLAISCSASPDGNTETTKHQRAQLLSDPELAADLVHRGPVLNMPQGEGDLFARVPFSLNGTLEYGSVWPKFSHAN